MTRSAVGEVFYAAIKSLPAPQREAVLERLLQDKSLQEDLFDLALIEQAKRHQGASLDAKTYFDRRRSR